MPLSSGTRLGPYEIQSPVGAGGMGEVYKARDSRLERDVALKVLPAEALADETARARLVREARLASKLNHPHICTIYEVGESDGQVFIAMELVEGQPLSARLTEGPLAAAEVLRFGQQLADALAHAHARGIVHRDLKSANVVITPENRAKVLDFGLAKRVTGEAPSDAATQSALSMTAPGVLTGTLAYMAPEQLQGAAADARSDIWALGVVLYEMTAGRRPFEGQTAFALSSAILSQAPPPLPPAVPTPLTAVIERCLAKEPEQRYQHGSDVQAALEAAQAGTAVTPWRGWRVLRRRPWLLGTTAGLAALLVIAVVLAALDAGGLRSRLAGGTGGPTRTVRLAVLPFANLSGDAEQEYLSDGVTTEMIAQLGRLHPETLSVIARTSVMRYKKTDKPVDQIGRELGVDYILEGSAQREAGRIRITAELIKVADQTQLWAERYERELAGILALQSDVAQRVAGALALKLLPGEQASLANARAVNPDAYEAYLKGSQYWIKMTKGDLDTAERYFGAALQKDPDYAAAYAGLAWVWACRNQMGLSPPAEAVPKMKAAAMKAVELDKSLAEAHYALAGLWTWQDWNLSAAGPEWNRALQLNPNYAEGVAMYSHFLMITGRPDEAMTQIDRALKLDPFNVTVHSFRAIVLLCARRYDDAITQARSALRMQPDAPVATTALIQALHAKQRYDEVIATAAAAYGSPLYDWPDVADALKKGYADLGYKGALRRAADLETARYGTMPGVANDAATNYMLAGEQARALEWFEKASEVRDPNLPYLNCFPLLDPLRGEPRFQSLLRRMGLPQ